MTINENMIGPSSTNCSLPVVDTQIYFSVSYSQLSNTGKHFLTESILKLRTDISTKMQELN